MSIRLPADLDGKPIMKSKNPETFFGVSEKPTVMPFVPVIGNYSTTWWSEKPRANRGNHQSEKTFFKGTRLFNLKNDPGESKDLSKDRPKVLKRLQELYLQWSSEIASQSLNLDK